MKLASIVFISGLASVSFGSFGTLSSFNTLAGAKLDVASTYTRAINFGGPAVPSSVAVQGILFLNDISAPNFTTTASEYADRFRPEYGSSTDENNLERVVGSIGYAGGAAVGGTFTNLLPGQYLVKTYFHEEFWGPTGQTRKFDYQIDGTVAFTNLDLGFKENNVSFVHEALITVAGNSLSFSATPGTGPQDPVPTISAITLQAVPEPATMAALGLGLAGLAKRRKRS